MPEPDATAHSPAEERPATARGAVVWEPATAYGLAWVTGESELIVEGGPSRRVFTGAAAAAVLPRLMDALNGTRSPGEVAAALGLTPAQVGQAIRLLDSAGLIDHAPPPAPAGPADCFLSRSVPAALRARGGNGLRRTLAASAVAVVADGQLGRLLAADLRETGVTVCAEPGSADLVIVADDGSATLTDVERECTARGVPLLRIGGDARHLELGPVFLGPHTACSACLRAGRKAAGWGASAVPPEAVPLACAMATGEAVALLTATTRPSTGRRVVRVEVDGLAGESFACLPEPGCEGCGLPDAYGTPYGRYEWLCRDEPWTAWETPEVAEADRWRDLDLASSPRLPCADAPLPAGLAELLGAMADRPALDTYVLGAAGLPHPVHRYSSLRDELIATRADLAACPPVTGLPPEPLAVLVLVATPGRLRGSHGDAAARRAFLRAGRALARLAAAPAARERRLVRTDPTSPGLRDLLELQDGREQVAAVVGVYER
ncbi:hypothetical protein [Spongiactinospora sp. TRM90649]|uniref:hypothetical protein n=1 Tax=Spongiactinospora sp. TRM90649 TaxID=3031114 RepID=UPI0023FA121D|nr:hypothetical protein [Spongiactinospora sp. TRM90649]MDF5757591.1 hypothetical protein [Spongiactinospora sp. TRM90649]